MFKRTNLVVAVASSVALTLLAPAAGASAESGTGTAVSQTEFKDAMIAASTAAKARETAGWAVEADFGGHKYAAAADPVSGTSRVSSTSPAVGKLPAMSLELTVKGDTAWLRLANDATTKAALALLDKPNVTHIKSASELARELELVPSEFAASAVFTSLDAFKGDVYTTLTKQATSNGDFAYHAVGKSTDKSTFDVTVVTAASDGALLGYSGTQSDGSGGQDKISYAVTYGQQTIALPPTEATLSASTFYRAFAAAGLPQALRFQVASIATKLNKSAAKRGAKVTISGVRKAARNQTYWVHKGFRKVITDVSTGARVRVQNPYTKKSYACSLIVVKGRAQSSNCRAV